jgi:hypothetical protein
MSANRLAIFFVLNVIMPSSPLNFGLSPAGLS